MISGIFDHHCRAALSSRAIFKNTSYPWAYRPPSVFQTFCFFGFCFWTEERLNVVDKASTFDPLVDLSATRGNINIITEIILFQVNMKEFFI
jgi:hypothetical protein